MGIKGEHMLKAVRPAITSFLLITCLTGIVYPLLVTGLSQALMRDKADGSLVSKNGKVIGSRLIGQYFSDPGHFWGRPSATSPTPYNGTASGGSNLGPTHPALLEALEARIKALKDSDPGNRAPIPVDLVTASASGLDPEISPAAAAYQISRIARSRKIDPERLKKLVDEHTRGRQFGFLGEPGVNVLELNLALDRMH